VLPSPTQIANLTYATNKYMMAMTPEAAGYLLARGISKEVAVAARLGFIAEPEPGHEHMQGMLAIPYLTRSGTVNIKARCIGDHSCKELKHPKYSGPHSSGTFLYNVLAFGDQDFICVAEGELDTLSLAAAGLPAIGIPGVAAWKANKHWPMCFTAYPRVYIFADNDNKAADGRNPGMDLAKRICDSIDSATIISLPENEDTNRCLVKYGPQFLREKVGL
jgi:DNA primase